MREIYALELSLLAKELKRFENFYIDKFYEIGEGAFRIRISRSGDRAELICAFKRGIWEAKEIPVQESATNFAMAMRKRVNGFLISKIEQAANDRIILFKLSKGEARMSLALEMLGKGNLILLDENMKISLAYRQESFKDRDIRNGKAYSMPKNDFLPYESISSIKQRAALGGSIISVLSKAVNIGPLYLEEALARCNIDPKSAAASIPPPALDRLIGVISDIISNAGKDYFIYSRDGKLVDYSACVIKKYENLVQTRLPGIMETIRDFYSNEVTKSTPKENKELNDLLASIEKQKKLVQESDTMIESNKMAGEAIFSNMKEINRMIEKLQKERRITKEDLQKTFDHIRIIELDLKNKTVTIEV